MTTMGDFVTDSGMLTASDAIGSGFSKDEFYRFVRHHDMKAECKMSEGDEYKSVMFRVGSENASVGCRMIGLHTITRENDRRSGSGEPEKKVGIVAMIMTLDRCIRHENDESVYDSRGLLFI